MTDLTESLSHAALGALESSRTAYTRYLHLLDAQRAALRSGDPALLSALAAEATTLLSRLERSTRLPPELGQHLHRAAGPRADAVRGALAALRQDAEAARAGIQELSGRLDLRRRALLGALAELSGGGHPSRPPHPAPSELDTTG